MMEKLIQINKWKLNDKQTLISYTADWCKPCKKIKPYLLKTMKEKEKIGVPELINKEDLRRPKFVPFFEIWEENKIIDSMQNSDKDSLYEFLQKNELQSKKYEREFDLEEDF